MKIIDKKTGKRFDNKDLELKSLNKILKENDPIIQNMEKVDNTEEFSPMSPPEAYDKDKAIGLDYKDASKILKTYMDDHSGVIKEVEKFEKALIEFKKKDFHFTKEINDTFNAFFVYFDNEILPHNRDEERNLFPILHKRLVESGEVGVGKNPDSAVDLMEDDHIKFIQLAALTFNFLGLASRLQDSNSRLLTYDIAYNTGKELVELIKLHIFREDNTLFPLAQKLLTNADFELISE